MFSFMLLERNVVFGTGVACLITCIGGVLAYLTRAEKHRKMLENEDSFLPPSKKASSSTSAKGNSSYAYDRLFSGGAGDKIM